MKAGFFTPLLILTFLASATLHAQIGGITGKVVYTRGDHVRVHALGDPHYVDVGEGDVARWGPHGDRIAVKDGRTIYVVDADGGNRIELVDDAEGRHCPIEFHPNGREVLFIRDDQIVAIDIDTRSERIVVAGIDCNGEIGISADGQRVVCRDDHILRAIDLVHGTDTEYADDHCSAGISPDGRLVMYNDNGKPHHLTVHIRQIDVDGAGSRPFATIRHRVADDEPMGDNHSWSNHNHWITFEGGKKRNGAPYMLNVITRRGYLMVDVEDTHYPDLWVAPEVTGTR